MPARIPFRFAPVPHDMLFERGMPAQVIVLWAAIYRLQDLAGGAAAIGQAELGEKLGWSDDTVARWAKKGRDLGWLAVRKRGQGLPNEYQALTLEPAELRLQEPAIVAGPPAESRVLSSTSREKQLESNEAPTARRDDLVSVATTILREAWEAQTPRPQQPYIAARKAVERALRDGWTADDLKAYFADQGFPVTGAMLDLWRGRRTQPNRAKVRAPIVPPSDGWSREGEGGVI